MQQYFGRYSFLVVERVVVVIVVDVVAVEVVADVEVVEEKVVVGLECQYQYLFDLLRTKTQ